MSRKTPAGFHLGNHLSVQRCMETLRPLGDTAERAKFPMAAKIKAELASAPAVSMPRKGWIFFEVNHVC